MAEPISNYGNFFTGAKNALLELSTLSTEEERLILEEARISKEISAEDRGINDRIEATLSKRLKEITNTYDAELKKADDAKKVAEAKREKAKIRKKGERIKDETKDLKDHIAGVRADIKDLMRKNGIPNFCNTSMYYTFYFPYRFMDFIKLLLAIVIIFLAIPMAVYKLIPMHRPIYLPFIYFAVILIFGGVYIIIGNITKARNRENLIKIRKMRDNIENDYKRINLIKKDINNDANEDRYDLTQFDRAIEDVDGKIDELNAKRLAAVNEFENSTKRIITDEIMENTKQARQKLKSELELTKQSLESIAARRSEINLYISDNYEVYLGKEFLQVDKIDALEKIIAEGQASNISEAIDLYQSQVSG